MAGLIGLVLWCIFVLGVGVWLLSRPQRDQPSCTCRGRRIFPDDHRQCCKHEHYTGITHPEVACLDCWLVWLEQNPGKGITADELLNILTLLEE